MGQVTGTVRRVSAAAGDPDLFLVTENDRRDVLVLI